MQSGYEHGLGARCHMNPRPGRWGLTVWCGSKGGADPQRKVEGSRRGRIAVVESKVDQLSHILVL